MLRAGGASTEHSQVATAQGTTIQWGLLRAGTPLPSSHPAMNASSKRETSLALPLSLALEGLVTVLCGCLHSTSCHILQSSASSSQLCTTVETTIEVTSRISHRLAFTSQSAQQTSPAACLNT